MAMRMGLILFLSGLLAALAMAESMNWEPTYRDEHIEVYTRPVPGYDIRAFRALTTVDHDLSQVVGFLLDDSRLTQWVHDCNRAEVVRPRKAGENQWAIYYVTDGPWLVSDRDYLLEYHLTQDPETLAIRIAFQGQRDFERREDGCVAMTDISGHWLLKPLPEGRTAIEYEVLADPAGELPTWLVNSVAVDSPYYTLDNLRREIEGRTYPTPELKSVRFPVRQ